MELGSPQPSRARFLSVPICVATVEGSPENQPTVSGPAAMATAKGGEKLVLRKPVFVVHQIRTWSCSDCICYVQDHTKVARRAGGRAPMAQDDSVVSSQWLHEHLGQPDVKVLDASWYMPVENRDPWQEYQVAHIPGALFFDIDGILDRTTDLPHMLPSEGAFAAAVSALDIKNHDKVIVYDGKGFFSAPRVWWMFRVYGHNKVWVLDGGLPQWRASGFDIESSCPGDAILKSKAANSDVEMVYNGQLANSVTFQTEFQPQLFWTLEKVKLTARSELFSAFRTCTGVKQIS
ncbi:hypothetical protein ABZP36_006809 [Zizania latifolia]